MDDVKIECLECGFIGNANIEDTRDGGLIYWCPECDQCAVIAISAEEVLE